jgi:hypothetical protein
LRRLVIMIGAATDNPRSCSRRQSHGSSQTAEYRSPERDGSAV